MLEYDVSKYILATVALNKVFSVGDAQVEALRDVNIQIPKSRLTVLRGRSGSGKTTLLNHLGLLDLPTSGKVYMNGQDMTLLSEAQQDATSRKQVGFVFQSVALITLMSAYENVEFALRLSGTPRNEWRTRTEEALGIVGLKNRMKHRPAELSGGEQQRVAIARAIAHRPEVIFADEPTAALDSNTGLRIMKLFRELVEQEGVTVVLSTHDPSMCDLADRVYTLEDGAIVEETDNDSTREAGVANG